MSDLVLTNGKIVTVDRRFSVAEALAVRNGRIAAVGNNSDIQAFLTPQARILDLKGRTVLPGINDSHVHASLLGGTLPPVALDVGAAGSRAALIQMVADKVMTTKPGEWIRGVGVESIFSSGGKGRQLPTRADLDRVSPDNPVYLGVAPFHGPQMALANTKALELAGVRPEWDSSEPTEPIVGRGVEALNTVLPPFNKEEKRRAIKTAVRRLNSLGITSITEPGLGPGGAGLYGGLWDNDCVEIYHELADRAELTVRVSILLLFTSYGAFDREMVSSNLSGKRLPVSRRSEWVRLAGIKLYADGIPPMHTAWMGEEYAGGGNGKMVFPGDSSEERCRALDELVVYAHNLGYQIGIHATGDRSISACVASFANAERANPQGLRHYVVHGDFTQPTEAPRMERFKIGLSVQPALAAAFLPLLRSAVGDARSDKLLALKDLIDSGVHVAGSSDSPVMSPDWRQGVRAAVLRESADNRVFSPEQRLSLEQAIRMYTTEGAWQDHMEHAKGSIEQGKLADFCILEGNILDSDPHSIAQLQIAMTIVGGEIVYDAGI